MVLDDARKAAVVDPQAVGAAADPGAGGAGRPASVARQRAGALRRSVARIGGLVIAMIAASIYFDVRNSAFLTTGNILLILEATSSLAIIALGETMVLLTGEIDLSVGSVYGLGAMATGLLWIHGWPFGLAVLVGLLSGVACGIVSGLITTVVRVNSFITTLGMLYLVQGITLQVSNSTAPNPLFTLPGYNIFEAFGADQVFNQVPVQIFWMAAIGLIMYFVIRRTKFGFRCAAIGGNPTAARIARLPVRSYKTICFMISGLFAVIGGLIDFSYVGTTQPTSGQQLPFEVFAAVILGGASLSGGRGTAIGTILGALFIALVNNGLSLIGYYASVQQIFLGAMIIIAVAIDVWTTGAKADGRGGNVLW